eukprot:2953681-Pleurochrysis_carterae.AAC.2
MPLETAVLMSEKSSAVEPEPPWKTRNSGVGEPDFVAAYSCRHKLARLSQQAHLYAKLLTAGFVGDAACYQRQGANQQIKLATMQYTARQALRGLQQCRGGGGGGGGTALVGPGAGRGAPGEA